MKLCELKVGDVLLFRATGLMAKIIKAVTKSEYNHVEIYIGRGLAVSIYPFKIGLRYCESSDCDLLYHVYRPTPALDKGQEKLLFNFATSELEKVKGYSLINFFGFLIIRFLRFIKFGLFEGNRFVICSEFVADCLTMIRVKKLNNLKNSLMSPEDIRTSFSLKRIDYQ